MAAGVIAALGINDDQFNDHITVISEDDKSNGNFVLSCILADHLSKDVGIGLVTLHNTFGHYHNVGMKLGYNLNATKDNGGLYLIEPIKSIVGCFLNNEQDRSDAENVQCTNYLSSNKENIVKQMYFEIKSIVKKLSSNKSRVCVIIDDISRLLDLKVSVADVICLVQHLRCLSQEIDGFSLVIGVHSVNEDDHVLLSSLSSMANLHVAISGLKTGWSKDVSSVMRIKRAEQQEHGLFFNLNEYHIKLLDRQVKIFAPGMAVI